MIQKLNHQHQICKKKLVYLFVFILFNIFLCNQIVFAQSDVDTNLSVDFSKFDSERSKNTADYFFQKALESDNTNDKEENLKKSAAQYYIVTNTDKANPYAYIQLARIYDMQKNDSYAKAYFFRALGINSTNSDANFYFGDFYFSRNQYRKALDYYQKALQYGKTDNSMLYKNIGYIYERFGDLPRANFYYKKSIALNPGDKDLASKVEESVEDEYEKSGYYKRRLRN